MNVNISLLTLIAVILIFKVNAINPSGLNIISPLDQGSSTSPCHSIYWEQLQSLLESYERDLRTCKNTESEQLAELLNEEQRSREAITESLKATCSTIKECIAESGNLDFFDCLDRSGDKNTRAVWKASRDSLDSAAPIREKIHHIQYKTGRCASKAELVYTMQTAEVTDDMMSCYNETEEKDQIEELEKLFRNHNEL